MWQTLDYFVTAPTKMGKKIRSLQSDAASKGTGCWDSHYFAAAPLCLFLLPSGISFHSAPLFVDDQTSSSSSDCCALANALQQRDAAAVGLSGNLHCAAAGNRALPSSRCSITIWRQLSRLQQTAIALRQPVCCSSHKAAQAELIGQSRRQ